MRRSCAAAMVAGVMLAGGSVWAETIKDPARGFILVLPEGFTRSSALQATEEYPYFFVKGDPADDVPDIYLVVEEFKGTISGNLKGSDVPSGFKGRHFLVPWQKFRVDVFEVPEEMHGCEYVTYNVQIPLKPRAIQLKLFGPASRKAELQRLLPAIVAGLDGQSNWTPSAVPGSFTSSGTYRYVLVAVAVVIVVGGAALFFLAARKGQERMLLPAGFLVLCAGWTVPWGQTREMLVVGGSVKMLGVVVIIMGLVSLVFRAIRALRARFNKTGPSGPA